MCLKFGSRDGKDSKKKDILVMNVTEENTVQLPLVEAFVVNHAMSLSNSGESGNRKLDHF